MTFPEVGVTNSEPARTFSLTYTAAPTPRVRLRIDTNRAVETPSVTYGGVAMTCTDKGRHAAPSVEHHFEIHNPPIGSHVISGTFSDEVLYAIRLFDDSWVAN